MTSLLARRPEIFCCSPRSRAVNHASDVIAEDAGHVQASPAPVGPVPRIDRVHPGLPQSTAYRYLDEVIEVLAARAPGLQEQLRGACGRQEQGTAFGHPKVRGKKLLIRGLNTLPFQRRFIRVPGAAFTMYSSAARAAAADARPAGHRQDRPLWRNS